MIHQLVRQARIECNLSQGQLAKLAGVTRERVRTFEQGRNITLRVFEKIVAQLPSLKELIIGGVRVTISGVDVEDVRAVIAEADLASRRLLALLAIIRAHAAEPFETATLAERLAELENRMQAIQGGAAGG